MITTCLRVAASMLLLAGLPAGAATLYVNVDSTNPVPPYTNWATAANVIQDAVDAASAGDTVLVTNGVYATGGKAVYGTMTNRVAVDKPLTLLSANGPEFTIIQGYQLPGTTNGDGAIRCVYLTNQASLVGFTLTGGATATGADARARNGGGVWGESTSALLSNCVIVSNAGRIGGGAYSVTLNYCQLVANSASSGGGAGSSVLNDCTIKQNRSTGYWGTGSSGGGGASDCALSGCLVIDNGSTTAGGGVSSSSLTNCLVRGNSAESGGGTVSSILVNCLLTHNTAVGGGPGGSDGSGGASARGTLFNCTLVGNAASTSGGGVYESVVWNCIIYSNQASFFLWDNYYFRFSGNMFASCSQPGWTSVQGNITNVPLFVDTNDWADLRLQSTSPCINAGNNAYVTTTNDLDGNPRIVGGTVDMGAYEFQSPQSSISYAWLQQYGLPTDGSADHQDGDNDKATTWQEWKAGTDPTNALSVLRMLNPEPGTNGTLVTWQSVPGHSYQLDRAIGAEGPFSVLRSNVVGQMGTTSVTDTNAVGDNPSFYRVGVGVPAE